ncbi:hypothetical protein I2I11_15655 [Pontibacter sp. 172403-2]|uniref:hypothetical protein n=1 Tax=Pontibacter rufus TaxID=2791028 RepID=UPI0018AFED63|nr:hypothetical protein [Pontibacter sp. 172403-2]MBF9254741.1 hypothetical protein [Pontibacter sp. 172403-2]
MNVDSLTTLITVVLAISLAGERLVTIIKTWITWLAIEKVTNTGEVDLANDKIRRFIVQVLSIIACWLTASFINDGSFRPNSEVLIGGKEFHVFLLGLLASGGSAFWTNILSYTKAVKDIKIQQKAYERLYFNGRSAPVGSTVAAPAGTTVPAPTRATVATTAGAIVRSGGQARPKFEWSKALT